MPHLHDTEIADTHPTSHLALKNIVFATDLSPTAKKALPYAVAFARQYKAAVYVVHALHPNVFPFALPDTWPMLIEAEEQVREEGKKELETALQGISHELFFNEGTVWEILSDAIRKNNADLIVLGTHGRSGIGKAVLGSVAEEVFRQATCPVLTVGPYVSLGGKLSMVLNRILYATDFSRA
jgi:nucleotide-binding universal stress UspA family protein